MRPLPHSHPFPDALSLYFNVSTAILSFKPVIAREGMEKCAVVNHLGPFLLTNLLLPDLRKSASSSSSAGDGLDTKNIPASRIVNVASRLEKRGKLLAATDHGLPPGTAWFKPPPGQFDGFQRYGTSKLYNMLFTFELDRRLSSTTKPPPSADGAGRVTVNAVTPGLVNTELGNSSVRPLFVWAIAPLKALLMRTTKKGAETPVWAATSAEVEHASGKFFGDMKEVPCSDMSKDDDMARRLWEASELASGLKEDERVL